jgi:hypothetical protein
VASSSKSGTFSIAGRSRNPTPSALHKKQLQFAAQFGICPGQQCRTLTGSGLENRVIQLFDLPETVWSHFWCANGFLLYGLNLRSDQALAESQSRLMARGEILSAASIPLRHSTEIAQLEYFGLVAPSARTMLGVRREASLRAGSFPAHIQGTK